MSNALKRLYKTISTLKGENENLRKELKTIRQRLCRIQTSTANTQTPRSKTDLILQKSGINPKSVPGIQNRLIYNECLNDKVQIAVDDNPARKKYCS